MGNIWKERQGLKVTEQRLCDQARMIRRNGWLTELVMNGIKKSMMNENEDKNDQNSGNDDDDNQGEATENEYENLVNVLQKNLSLSFENVVGISEVEKIMIKNVIEIAEYNSDEEVNGFKKADRNLFKDWTMKVNAILKEIKSDNTTEANRLIKSMCHPCGMKSRSQTKPKKRKCSERTLAEKKNTTVNTRVTETY